MKKSYSIYGLNVNSAIPLPGTDSETFLDVDLCFSDQPLSLPHITAHNAQWQTDGTQLLSTIPSLGQALIKSMHTVTIFPKPGLCHEHMTTFTLGSGLAASLYLNNNIPLHGAAIATNKGAVLFLGASGRGKSTLALTAASLNYPILSDDVISLRHLPDNNGIVVYPSHTRLKTTFENAVALGFNINSNQRTAPEAEKFPCYLPNELVCELALPVTAIYFLQEQASDQRHHLKKITHAHGIEALRKHCYRPGLLSLLQKQPQLLQQSVALAKQAMFYQLWLPSMNICGNISGYRQWLHDFLQN